MDNSPSPALAKLAEALRRHRKLAGLTQAELAQRIPCSDKTISAIEVGRERPSRQMILAIEKALGLSQGALVDIYDLLDAEGLPGWMRDWVIEERRSTTLLPTGDRPWTATDRGVRAGHPGQRDRRSGPPRTPGDSRRR